jgi:hypothetical protein
VQCRTGEGEPSLLELVQQQVEDSLGSVVVVLVVAWIVDDNLLPGIMEIVAYLTVDE